MNDTVVSHMSSGVPTPTKRYVCLMPQNWGQAVATDLLWSLQKQSPRHRGLPGAKRTDILPLFGYLIILFSAFSFFPNCPCMHQLKFGQVVCSGRSSTVRHCKHGVKADKACARSFINIKSYFNNVNFRVLYLISLIVKYHFCF